DFCVRAKKAGFRVLIAKDAFVHHFGSTTFRASGIDLQRVLADNEKVFRTKWSSSDDELNPESFSVQAPAEGLRLVRNDVLLSLCMIVRDNAGTLKACLESIRPWVDEMIVVDTGSTDKTPVIAQQLGAKVFHFPWCDDFS